MAISITLPVIDLATVKALERAATETFETETSALFALRTKYGPLAKHGGFIKLASSESSGDGWKRNHQCYLKDENHVRTRAFLVIDEFAETKDAVATGSNDGCRLYLTQDGTWIELKRQGRWVSGRNGPDNWTCGVWWETSDGSDPSLGRGPAPGSCLVVDDAYVASEYNLRDILEGLAASLHKCAESLPQRWTKLRQRTELARHVTQALTEGK